MFNILVIAMTLLATSAALSAVHENEKDPDLSNLIVSNNSLDIDRRFSFAMSFHQEPLDNQAFNIVSLFSAIHFTNYNPHAIVHTQQFAFPNHPGCAIAILRDSRPERLLTVRVVLYGLYEAVRSIASQPSYTEAYMTLYWEGKAVGALTWRLNPVSLATSLVQGTSINSTDLILDLNQSLNTTTLTASDIDGPENDILRITTDFVSNVQLSNKRFFIVLMDTVVDLGIRYLLPELPYVWPNVDARAAISVDKPDGRVRPPFLTRKMTIISMGRIAVFYVQAVGWRESDTKIYWNRQMVGKTTVRAWNPPSGELPEDVS